MTGRKIKILILSILTLLFLSEKYCFAQVGGPSNPLLNSTHTYRIPMSNVNYNPSWFVYAEGTDVTNINSRTPIYSLGSGSKSGGNALITIAFTSAKYTLGTRYVIVYNEEETNPVYVACENYRFYPIIIGPIFDVEINPLGFPTNVCLTEPVSFRTNPSGNITIDTLIYRVHINSPIDYAYSWNFSYSIITEALRTGFSDAIITGIDINGTPIDPDPMVSEYEKLLSVPNSTTEVIFKVVYSIPPGSAQNLTFKISSIEGNYKEPDTNDPQSMSHQIYRLPFPSAITAVD